MVGRTRAHLRRFTGRPAEHGRANSGVMKVLNQIKFNSDGLVPAIVQEAGTRRVLMLAWMNRESVEKTVATRRTHFWSRSRQKLWIKGETSGHIQTVEDLYFDCDGDTLLVTVRQVGPACHEGYQSCFYRRVTEEGANFSVTEAPIGKTGSA